MLQGFSLSFGSQLWLLWDHRESALKQQAINFLNPNKLTGLFVRLAGNDTIPWPSGALKFIQSTGISVDVSQNHFMTDTCTRSPNAPFYLRSWSWKWLFLLVPSYTLISAFRNLQPLTRQRKVLKQIVAMILISSAAYAGVLCSPSSIAFLLTDSLFSANRVSSRYFSRSDSVTAVGAVVVGLVGNLYSRIFKGYAYPTMVPGVLFLIPVCHCKLVMPFTNPPFALPVRNLIRGRRIVHRREHYIAYTSGLHWRYRRPRAVELRRV